MEATATSASLYTLRGSYEYPDKSQKPQCYLWHSPVGAQAGAEWLTGFILNSDQNLKILLSTVVALLINLITSPLS